MSAREWRPLSSRQQGAALAWRQEVPAALERPLRKWIQDTLNPASVGAIGISGIPGRVLLKLDLVLPDADDDDLHSSERARQFLTWQTPAEVLPDVIDTILHLLPLNFAAPRDPAAPKPSGVSVFFEAMAGTHQLRLTQQRRELTRLLDDSLSILRIQADGRGLERRTDPVAEAALNEAVGAAEIAVTAGSSAAHLRTAWASLHALHSDPGKAYAEAIKAVEAAAHAMVEPNNSKATLGSMIGELRKSEKRYSLVIGKNRDRDVSTLIGCLLLLWEGQTSRHGSSAETRLETPDEAAAAVHLAVTLVQWFTTGAVRKHNK
jgi:hypothetical protein